MIITADLDFPGFWLYTLRAEGPGLILLRGGNYNELESLDCVRRVLMSVAQDELARSIVVVDRDRIHPATGFSVSQYCGRNYGFGILGEYEFAGK